MTTSRNPAVSGNLVSFRSWLLTAPQTNVVKHVTNRCLPSYKTAESVKHLVAANIVTFSHEDEKELSGWYE